MKKKRTYGSTDVEKIDPLAIVQLVLTMVLGDNYISPWTTITSPHLADKPTEASLTLAGLPCEGQAGA